MTTRNGRIKPEVIAARRRMIRAAREVRIEFNSIHYIKTTKDEAQYLVNENDNAFHFDHGGILYVEPRAEDHVPHEKFR